MANDDSFPPSLVLDPEIVARFLPFARSFADEDNLSDEELTGADLRHLADYLERAAGSVIIRRVTHPR